MCIGIFKNKWRSFIPTAKYLQVVKPLTTISKLHDYLKQYTWQGEKGDHWKTPMEFIENKDNNNDCEDFSRFAVDVLVRIIKLTEARFVTYHTFKSGHAICAFPYRGKLAIFSNKVFHSGFGDYVEIGHKYYPDGLKRMVVRDWQGKILQKKRKMIGKF